MHGMAEEFSVDELEELACYVDRVLVGYVWLLYSEVNVGQFLSPLVRHLSYFRGCRV